MSSPILADFDCRAPTFEGLRDYLNRLLADLLRINGIRFHKIESRIKDRKSLKDKLARPTKDYASLDDLTDICGLRVITHSKSEVDEIATIVEREFDIDQQNSIDKRIYSDPDRFGYISLHYVISLSKDRLKLPECSAWSGYKAELQIRTILQHAWAEIEHDLAFKSRFAVPAEIKRRFARLAALLELADDEFAGIKTHLAAYSVRVSKELKTAQPQVAIDGPSVMQLLKSDPIIMECEREIANRSNRPFNEPDAQKCSLLADFLHTVGITTVTALHAFLLPNKNAVINVAVDRLSLSQGPVGAGITLLYVCYGVFAQNRDFDAFENFLHTHGFGGKESNREFLESIVAAFDQEWR
jgi:GTP pyrophosphokinase